MIGMPDFFLHVYNELKNIYNSDSNKELNKQYILKKLCEYFQRPKSSLDVYKLKVLMETRFMRDIKCRYTFLITPEKCGCDLRELIFNYLSEEQKSTVLTNIVKTRLHTINHILTDIDDTIFPNYNGFVETFGSDTSWVPNKLYPGIAKFYEHFYKTLPLKETRYSTILSGTPVFLKNMRLHNNKIQTAIGPNFGFLQGFEGLWLSLDVFNLLQIQNTVSYTWIRDNNSAQYAVPNYLTNRQINLKLTGTLGRSRKK